MNRNRWIFALAILLVGSLACNAISGTSTAPTSGDSAVATVAPAEDNSNEAPGPSGNGSGVDKTEFPLPENVSNFTDMGDGAINFQTTISIKDAIDFYREAFSKAGYKEREINTAITETTFSMVFDGHASGKAIVIQGVDLGGGSTNINIRFEDV